MHRALVLALATLAAAPALAGGDHVDREDLHHDAPGNTRTPQRQDRTVDREDLQSDVGGDPIRKADLSREAADVRLENGLYIVTEDFGDGRRIEVAHDQTAIESAAEAVEWHVDAVADDLNASAKDLVRRGHPLTP